MSFAGVAMELEAENELLKKRVAELEATVDALEDELIEAGIALEMAAQDQS
jgi:cell division protein FtsB